MAVDHDAVVGCSLDDAACVVDHPLRSVVFGAGDDCADVAGLDGVVVVVFHKLEGAVELELIVGGVAGGLVVHDELDAALFGVVAEGVDVEVGVCLVEEELPVLAECCPVFPAFVPALDEYAVDAVVGCEVDVALDVGGVGGVVSVGAELGVVGYAGFGESVVGVCPRLDVAGEHFPPYADELHWLDPGCILDFTGFVEV